MTPLGGCGAGVIPARSHTHCDGCLPCHTRAPLAQALEPRRGERILEIGPGLGQHAVQVAQAVGGTGQVDVVDIQQGMLDATVGRAERNGITNIVPVHADASERLPYEDDAFDAAFVMGVLGEIPDRERALAELHRTLKPGGRPSWEKWSWIPTLCPPGGCASWLKGLASVSTAALARPSRTTHALSPSEPKRRRFTKYV